MHSKYCLQLVWCGIFPNPLGGQRWTGIEVVVDNLDVVNIFTVAVGSFVVKSVVNSGIVVVSTSFSVVCVVSSSSVVVCIAVDVSGTVVVVQSSQVSGLPK